MSNRKLSQLLDDLLEEQSVRRRSDVNWEYIAYHEAGHAVIGHVLGYKVGKVTIKPKPFTLGNVEMEVGEASSDRCVDRDAADIKSDLAGMLAERLINPSPLNELIEQGSRSDWRSAKRTARQLNLPREAEILIVMLALETAALVQQNREAIVRVATALLERETLTGDDLHSLIDGRHG
jgi:ATP-dependent Zn protease